ncbi:mitochondrial antiviral-signaling protein-like isoform X1 [Orbicella faveolata]|uniref:mitochondrial antiviral-signaling protein-like isoform X1 n=1 Tax=Orbicella faveolata TaxID=48498 RepID=UPI0009E452AD|nr:mitochondrial antiviral-signaling protein-like isoform X1 [Orbicella faveolata]
MEMEQRELIRRYISSLVDDVIPVDMLPYLSCLTSNDKEEIRCEETNHGPMRATQKLVERLIRRPNAFQEFIRALRETGCEHLAELLYPQEEEAAEEDIRNEENVEARFLEQVALEDVNHL